jgi:hypothetical protein
MGLGQKLLVRLVRLVLLLLVLLLLLLLLLGGRRPLGEGCCWWVVWVHQVNLA